MQKDTYGVSLHTNTTNAAGRSAALDDDLQETY